MNLHILERERERENSSSTLKSWFCTCRKVSDIQVWSLLKKKISVKTSHDVLLWSGSIKRVASVFSMVFLLFLALLSSDPAYLEHQHLFCLKKKCWIQKPTVFRCCSWNFGGSTFTFVKNVHVNDDDPNKHQWPLHKDIELHIASKSYTSYTGSFGSFIFPYKKSQDSDTYWVGPP